MRNTNIYNNFADAYSAILNEVCNNPEYKSNPRDKRTRESCDIQYTVTNPDKNLFKNEIRSIPENYLKGEMIWYFSGTNEVDYILKYSKFWANILNPDGKTVNSAYGYNVLVEQNEHSITEFDWALESLVADTDSRQAIIRFNKPKHSFKGNKDFVCTIYGIFRIRDNKLHFTVHQRSCDVIRGLTFDFPFFSMLQQVMLKELNLEMGGKIELGSLTHIINSVHIYEEHFLLAENMLSYPFTEDAMPLLDVELNTLMYHSKMLVNNNKDNDTTSILINWLKNN
jgi:thymidylate synthase